MDDTVFFCLGAVAKGCHSCLLWIVLFSLVVVAAVVALLSLFLVVTVCVVVTVSFDDVMLLFSFPHLLIGHNGSL